MPKKKHTILTVLLILMGIGVFFTGAIALVLHFSGHRAMSPFSTKIGVIPIEGPISDSRAALSQLVEFQKDDTIRAIILRIDSGGGAVGPTQEIYRQVSKITGKKTVIASMGGVAASGGYYIAAAADKIVANPGTITGSIGVLMEFFRFEELFKKLGVQLEVLKSGKFKDVGSPHRTLTEEERELLSGVLRDIGRQFVEGVAAGRGLPVSKVDKIADGRIFTGAQAKELGLVDELGNFQDAVALAKEMAGIDGDAKLIYPERPRPGLLDILMESAVKSLIKSIRSEKRSVDYRWTGPSDPAS